MNPPAAFGKKSSDPETGQAVAVEVGDHLPVDAQRFAHIALHLGDLHLKIDLLRARNGDAVFHRNLFREGGYCQAQGEVGLGD